MACSKRLEAIDPARGAERRASSNSTARTARSARGLSCLLTSCAGLRRRPDRGTTPLRRDILGPHWCRLPSCTRSRIDGWPSAGCWRWHWSWSRLPRSVRDR